MGAPRGDKTTLKNILIINSSNRLQGNTYVALSFLEDKLKKLGFFVESINLAQKNIQTCRGCRLCFNNGEKNCPLHDDILSIFELIQKQDFILIGSPIYVEDINGILKNWIDRMAFNCHRPVLFRKKAFIICTSGVGTSGHGLQTIERAFQTWGIQTIGKDKYICGEKIDKKQFDVKYIKRVNRAVDKINASLGKDTKPSFIAVLTFGIQKRYYSEGKDRTSYDYQFWKAQGWLEPDRVFYTDESVNRVKVEIALLLGKVIKAIVLR